MSAPDPTRATRSRPLAWVRGGTWRLLGAVAVVVVLALVVVLLVGVLGPDRPRAVAGQRIDLGAVDVDATPPSGTTVELSLPTGDVELVVGEAVDELPGVREDEQPGIDPPDGGAFLPVAWRYVDERPVVVPAVDVAPAPEPELTLVVDGQELPLGAVPLARADSLEGFFDYVAVPTRDGGLEDGELEVVVTFAGEEQRFRLDGDGVAETDAGRFAPYEDRAVTDAVVSGVAAQNPVRLPLQVPPGYAPGEPYPGTSDSEPDGTGTLFVVAAGRTPYVAGLGWAPEGQEWAVLRAAPDRFVTLRAGFATIGVTDLLATDVAYAVTVDGADADADDGDSDGGAGDAGPLVVPDPFRGIYSGGVATVVAPVPAGTAGVRLEAEAEVDAVYASDPELGQIDPPSPTVDLRWSDEVPLG